MTLVEFQQLCGCRVHLKFNCISQYPSDGLNSSGLPWTSTISRISRVVYSLIAGQSPQRSQYRGQGIGSDSARQRVSVPSLAKEGSWCSRSGLQSSPVHSRQQATEAPTNRSAVGLLVWKSVCTTPIRSGHRTHPNHRRPANISWLHTASCDAVLQVSERHRQERPCVEVPNP
jgi:hypothetical protein